MRGISSLILLLVGAAVSNGAMDLTDSNWDEELGKGKFTFVKFLAPWCGHCKSLKPDWDKLGEHFNKGKDALIADVDCTQDNGKELCTKFGVSGYPTIKYFCKDCDKDGESYDGARDYNALKKFVKQSSKSPCNPETQENCSKKDIKFLEEIKDWTEDKMKEELESMSTKISEAKSKQEEAAKEFERLKDIAIAKNKEAEELKKEFEKIKKSSKTKVKILEQKTGGKKDEL